MILNKKISLDYMSTESKEIEKPWCTYKGVVGLVSGFGKIVDETKEAVNILYSEGQNCQEPWAKKNITRFDTLEEAVEHYIENRGACDLRERQTSPEQIRLFARASFPSYFNKKQ
jgi:hypothetical protein